MAVNADMGDGHMVHVGPGEVLTFDRLYNGTWRPMPDSTVAENMISKMRGDLLEALLNMDGSEYPIVVGGALAGALGMAIKQSENPAQMIGLTEEMVRVCAEVAPAPPNALLAAAIAGIEQQVVMARGKVESATEGGWYDGLAMFIQGLELALSVAKGVEG